MTARSDGKAIVPTPTAQLSWSHYEKLLQVNDEKARNWYANEAYTQAWGVRTLQRNISSQYYYRILRLQDKASVENEMKALISPLQDKLEFIKNPIIAEFLGMKQDESYHESNLEQCIIDNLQKFLMELGKGFAFVADSSIPLLRCLNSITIKKENDAIKNGEIPEEWLESDNKNKLAQKDTDARWAKKNDELHYGYKDHVSVDSKSKLIKDYEVNDAAVHDSNKCVEFIDEKDKAFYADSAYYCEKISYQIPVSMENCILEKATRNHPLTSEQKQSNKERSRIRCRIEHVFGTMERQLGDIVIRCIGTERAKFQICMKNFIYNIVRYTFLRKASL